MITPLLPIKNCASSVLLTITTVTASKILTGKHYLSINMQCKITLKD